MRGQVASISSCVITDSVAFIGGFFMNSGSLDPSFLICAKDSVPHIENRQHEKPFVRRAENPLQRTRRATAVHGVGGGR